MRNGPLGYFGRWDACAEGSMIAVRNSSALISALSVECGDRLVIFRGYIAGCGLSSREDFVELCIEQLENGEESLYQMDGNFTIVVYDRSDNSLFAYRSMLSTCAVYYVRTRYGVAVADTCAGLHYHEEIDVTPLEGALALLFMYRTVSGDRTLMGDVRCLSPGEILRCNRFGVHVEQVVDFRDYSSTTIPPEAAVEQVESTMYDILYDIATIRPDAVNLLSGGVDSSYIQVHWNRIVKSPSSCCAVVNHPKTEADMLLARAVAQELGNSHHEYCVDQPIMALLGATIRETGEMPNHVQSGYFYFLGQRLRKDGISSAICGEGADSLFGTQLSVDMARSLRLARLIRGSGARSVLSWIADISKHPTFARILRLVDCAADPSDEKHPYNTAGAFTDWPAVFGSLPRSLITEAFNYRQEYVRTIADSSDTVEFAHNIALILEGLPTATLWTTLMGLNGVEMYCPYLDSRMLRVALSVPRDLRFNGDEAKVLVKSGLERHLPQELVRRPKLGFGQPIFEWLSPDGELREEVDAIVDLPFVSKKNIEEMKERPTWVLYTGLCFHLWRKEFLG